ncbi:MAG: CoA ester lyase [Chloroflexota bacterium]|nr:CoA ester lyase [Chloroflexota bacterium]
MSNANQESRSNVRLERSELIVPASNWAMIQKAANSAADAVCIDLEDAVAPSEKAASRANVVRAFRELDFGSRLRVYRINGLDTYFAYRDLIEVVEEVGNKLDLIIVPKVNRPEDVYWVETLLSQIEAYKNFSNRIGLEAQIETALGCVNVKEIAASSPRLEALVFGPGDYAASVQMPLDSIGEFDENDKVYPGHRWHYVMHSIVSAARAYNKRAIDGPFAGIKDPVGLAHTCQIGRVMGFDGKWCIHPNQIEAVNKTFSPADKEIKWAQTVVDEYEKAIAEGRGAISVNGKMVDAASLRVANSLVEKARLAGLI